MTFRPVRSVLGLEQLPDWQAALPNSPGEGYLIKRGIPFGIARQYGLGWASPGAWPNGDPDYGYLVFPISIGAYRPRGPSGLPAPGRAQSWPPSQDQRPGRAVQRWRAGEPADLTARLRGAAGCVSAGGLRVACRSAGGHGPGRARAGVLPLSGVLLALGSDPARKKATISAASALQALGIAVKRLPAGALGDADDRNAAHMAGTLRLPLLPC